jgi:hypothetical protein
MAGDDYDDDDFETGGDELDSAIDSFLGIDEKEEEDNVTSIRAYRQSARRRIEDYMERRRLREEDIDYDFELEEAE